VSRELPSAFFTDGMNADVFVASLALCTFVTMQAYVSTCSVDNPDLVEYAKLLDIALHKALPKGKYIDKSTSKESVDKDVVTAFTTKFELEDGDTYIDAKDAFKDEFESEIGSAGYLVPKSYVLQSSEYDFFDTYSIIRFNAIFPVSKDHPDAGSYAPFSLAIYKKKGDNTVHIAFPSITNWVNDLGISDKESLNEVKKTQNMVAGILKELTEE